MDHVMILPAQSLSAGFVVMLYLNQRIGSSWEILISTALWITELDPVAILLTLLFSMMRLGILV